MTHKESSSNFYIKSGNSEFADRQKSIFSQLAFVAKEQSDEHEVMSGSRPRPRQLPIFNDEDDGEQASTKSFRKPKVILKRNFVEMKQFQGQESIFKRPDDPPPQFNPKFKARTRATGIPDYHTNPHKWIKYSLDDVSKEDLSNRSNTLAAFSFLQEIAARKAADDGDTQDEEDTEKKIAFKRPKKTRLQEEDSTESKSEESKPTFKSSKLVMPEYIIGQSKKKERKRRAVPKEEKIKEIPLNHLCDEEEEEANIE